MLLSDLQTKDVINLIDGRKIGSIVDATIAKEGAISELLVQKKRLLFFMGSPIKISWQQIDKIGKDVILVNVKT